MPGTHKTNQHRPYLSSSSSIEILELLSTVPVWGSVKQSTKHRPIPWQMLDYFSPVLSLCSSILYGFPVLVTPLHTRPFHWQTQILDIIYWIALWLDVKCHSRKSCELPDLFGSWIFSFLYWDFFKNNHSMPGGGGVWLYSMHSPGRGRRISDFKASLIYQFHYNKTMLLIRLVSSFIYTHLYQTYHRTTKKRGVGVGISCSKVVLTRCLYKQT